MKAFHSEIIACYLYTITKHGYPPSAERFTEHLEEFKRLGFSSIELEGIHGDHLLSVYKLKNHIKSKAEDLRLKIPVFCVVLPALSSPEQKERVKNLSLFEKGCEIAKTLGARFVLDNAPIPPFQFPEGIPVTRHYDEEVLSVASLPNSLNWKSYWKALVETYREACDIASKYNLSYHLHPCYGALINNSDAFLLFFDSVKRDNLKFNLDTANQYFMKENIFLSLIRLKDHVDYIHISDNGGHRVEHLAPGKGSIPWTKFFETLDMIGYKGNFGIDIGGAESAVPDLEKAYMDAASWLEQNWFQFNS